MSSNERWTVLVTSEEFELDRYQQADYQSLNQTENTAGCLGTAGCEVWKDRPCMLPLSALCLAPGQSQCLNRAALQLPRKLRQGGR